jgi:hypothetical protein
MGLGLRRPRKKPSRSSPSPGCEHASQLHRKAAWRQRVHPLVGMHVVEGARSGATFPSRSLSLRFAHRHAGDLSRSVQRCEEKEERERMGARVPRVHVSGFVQPRIAHSRRMQTSGYIWMGSDVAQVGEEVSRPRPWTRPGAWGCALRK